MISYLLLCCATMAGVGNKFLDNHFTVTSSAGPLWFIHASVDIKDNIFDGNSYTGPLQKAGISIESSWAATALTWSYGNLVSTYTTMGSFNADGNKITNNRINTPSSVPAIVLHAVADAGGAYNVTNTVIRDNEIIGSNHPQMVLFVESGAAKITGTDMGGNRYPENSPISKFEIGNAAMFNNIEKDTNRPSVVWETTGSPNAVRNVVNLSISSGIIAVPAEDRLFVMLTQPASPMQLTQIQGGQVGQIITVRYATGIIVKHGSSSLRLIGGKDSPSMDASKISMFACISGNGVPGNNSIWTEISRN